MLKALKYLLIALLLWFIIHSIYVVADGLHDDGATADVAVILGTKVNEDGTLSPRLNARVQKGYELYKAGRVKKLMVSGGIGKEGYPEGIVMAIKLEEMGVPAADVIIDNEGNNSFLTALNYKFVSTLRHYNSVIVVSQYFHITRTKLVFRKLGIQNVSGAAPKYFEWRDIYSLSREFPGFYWYWLRY